MDKPKIQVSFKDEGEMDGYIIGPVSIINVADLKADPVIAESKYGMPYGYKPAGRAEVGWRTLPDAKAIAAALGVELTRL